MSDALLLLSLLLALVAAASDFRSLRIPNAIPAGIAIAFFIAAIYDGLPLSFLGSHAAVSLVVLLVCVGLFAARLLGGGDGKLLAALSLWAGPELALPFLIYTTLIGGVFAFAALTVNRMPLPVWAYSINWISAPTAKRRAIPYGVAIALGAVATFWSRIT